MDNITKIYANGLVANKDVTFECTKGEIHALLGENGAGKTTLMKVLFGFETPEEGRILLRGEEVKINGPLDAIDKGVGMVHQHFMLVDELTVAENVVLGDEPTTRQLFDMNKAIKITRDLSDKYNLAVDPRMLVGDCTVGVKQKIEILKALLRGAEVLILDEPTAVLTPQETVELFVELKNLCKMGHTIIFISHKLNEVKELCDRFTVLRKGCTIGSGRVSDYTEQQISNMMVGRDVVLEITKDHANPGSEVVRVSHLSYTSSSGKNILNDVSFSLRKGQILGIAGVEGNGQNELSEILTGLRTFKRGDITINDCNIQGMSVLQLREIGVASISEDRMTYGCASAMSIRDNIIADRYYKKKYAKGIVLKMKEIDKEVKNYIEAFQISCSSAVSAVNMLSGGNIQKVIVAREFTSGANVIIANQPTRGIDVGATEFIRNQLIRLTRENDVSVLLISADLNEVMEVSDSLLVMHEGAISAYFAETSVVSETELGEFMLGVRKMEPEELRRAIYDKE